MPPSRPPIFSCVASSTFFDASLKAASIMSCSISTSPATSASIFTFVTIFLPSIPTVTMPPPAVASTRISAISSCIFFCICSACFIMACMFPGSFINPALLLKITHHADLRVGKHLLEAPHFRMRESALGHVVLEWFQLGNRCYIRLAKCSFHAYGTAGDFLHDLQDILFVHRQFELFGRRKMQLVVRLDDVRVFHGVGCELHARF